jgi:hypothetical protein
MPRHPVDGIAGSKPRVPAEKGNGKVSKAELTQLNREYLVARNAQMAAKAAMSQMEAKIAECAKPAGLCMQFACSFSRKTTLFGAISCNLQCPIHGRAFYLTSLRQVA